MFRFERVNQFGADENDEFRFVASDRTAAEEQVEHRDVAEPRHADFAAVLLVLNQTGDRQPLTFAKVDCACKRFRRSRPGMPLTESELLIELTVGATCKRT